MTLSMNLGTLCYLHQDTVSPLTLSAICSRWRHIALHTPPLWASLSLALDNLGHDAITESLAETFVEQWFSRAASLPLALLIHAELPVFPLSRLRSIICCYSDRVQYLSLDIGDRDLMDLGIDSQHFSCLQRIRLNWRPPLEYSDGTIVNVLNSAPQLSDCLLLGAVELTDGVASEEGVAFVAPWSQLNRFEGYISGVELFALASNLLEAKCRLVDTAHSIITNTSLRALTIEEESADILEHLTLPALQSLDIHNALDYCSLQPFLIRSSPHIVSLVIRGHIQDVHEWHGCLSLLDSSLETLTIHCLTSSAFDRLIGEDHNKSLAGLSRLKSLRFYDVQRDWVDLRNIVNFLSGTTLLSFTLTWAMSPFFDSPDLLPSGLGTADTIRGHLSTIYRSGMDIYIGTDTKNYACIKGVSFACCGSILDTHFKHHPRICQHPFPKHS